ncbi:MAG: peptide chain release factor 2 [Parcubacteria group bacterium]|nr:peptide chain release factor 2 [Parcubacteria group bacterium]
MARKSFISRTGFDVAQTYEKISSLEQEAQKPDFWQNKEKAIELGELRDEKKEWENLEKRYFDLKENIETIAALEKESGQEETELRSDFLKETEVLGKDLRKLELKKFLSGRFDKKDAILSIYGGAGGVDAQDWAMILFRMYEKYAQKRGWNFKILDRSFGEQGGLKSAMAEIQGKMAYGWLKGEQGVHRLVRVSPFSAKNLRHTSFASVEILPSLKDELKKEIEISDKDLKIEMFRSSGPGGQNVNKRETAIRLIYIPTGLQVAVQSERYQGANREKAMEILRFKLYQKREEETRKVLSGIKGGKKIEAAWGHQIRSYVFHPYKMVKDHRTGIETAQVEKVLNGEIDEFIEAELKELL